MARAFTWIGVVIGVASVFCVSIGLWIHEDRPPLTPSDEADALAFKMLGAVEDAHWRDYSVIEFRFRGRAYRWMPKRGRVVITRKNRVIFLDLQDMSCRPGEPNQTISPSECSREHIYWNNNSFWLHPFGKVFDPGTTRSLCWPEGQTDSNPWLCVQFGLGGDTPGDLYALNLNRDGLPVRWKMWVSISPVGGVESEWSGWRRLPSGGWYAGRRTVLGYTIPVSMDGASL